MRMEKLECLSLGNNYIMRAKSLRKANLSLKYVYLSNSLIILGKNYVNDFQQLSKVNNKKLLILGAQSYDELTE